MALSTFKLLRTVKTERHFIRRFVLVPNATAGQGYNATTGQTVDFTLATNPSGIARKLPGGTPLFTEDDITIVKNPLGFQAEIKQASSSATLKNFVLRIFDTAAAAELTTANYPAAVGGKDIVIDVTTPKSRG